MKKILLFTSSLIFIFSCASSQNVNLPNNSFSGGIKVPCAYDTGHKVYTFKEWEGYQTTDSLWWGPRDTTACFDIADTIGKYGTIYYDEVNTDESVFIHYRFNDSNAIELDTNNIYEISLYFNPKNNDYSKIDTAGNC